MRDGRLHPLSHARNFWKLAYSARDMFRDDLNDLDYAIGSEENEP